jgi:hypothetical protein
MRMQEATQVISNQFYQLTFDSETGRLSNIANLVSGVQSNVGICRFVMTFTMADICYAAFSWTKHSHGSMLVPETLLGGTILVRYRLSPFYRNL